MFRWGPGPPMQTLCTLVLFATYMYIGKLYIVCGGKSPLCDWLVIPLMLFRWTCSSLRWITSLGLCIEQWPFWTSSTTTSPPRHGSSLILLLTGERERERALNHWLVRYSQCFVLMIGGAHFVRGCHWASSASVHSCRHTVLWYWRTSSTLGRKLPPSIPPSWPAGVSPTNAALRRLTPSWSGMINSSGNYRNRPVIWRCCKNCWRQASSTLDSSMSKYWTKSEFSM